MPYSELAIAVMRNNFDKARRQYLADLMKEAEEREKRQRDEIIRQAEEERKIKEYKSKKSWICYQ
jgi:hypothetical protein